MTATTRVVNGEEVSLTAEEIASIEAEWAARDTAAQAERDSEAILAYRRSRRAAYIERLGVESDEIITIGDVLDVLIKKVRALEAGKPEPEFDAMIAEIDTIKAENPKP